MSQDIRLLNVNYDDVPAVTLPKQNGGTATFYDVSGSQTITQNGTYDVTDKAEVVVNVSGGGGASQTIYSGTSEPSASIGSNGDIYIKASSGGSLEGYPESFEASNVNSTSNLSACLGVSADDGSSTSNCYSSGSSKTGVIDYSFDLSSIPSSATINSISCRVMAHEENSSRSSFKLQLYSGTTAKGSATTIDGTSNRIYTLSVGSWTRAELDTLILKMQVGYYGGLIAGATLTIGYEMSDPSYEVTLSGNASTWSISGSAIYKKTNGSWNSVSSVELENTIERS